eukprot:TRINITY_DN12712_c0_g5_i2.p1 TRINITY_DN12712_c0_g5~~TRINITY_DN12712_c0_g5_i2.p1  ORF type:complete len:259 (-),score=53.12 TRINITY_DN12712_c0_g5_i2:368-1144(-)
MSAYQFEKSMLQLLIEGLRHLYNYLSESDSNNAKSSDKLKEKTSLIRILYEVHTLSQQKAKCTSNSGFSLFKLPDHVFTKYFLCYFSLNDVCRLTLVCSEFGKRIRSNLFLLHYVKVQEKTDIKVDLNAFSGPLKKVFAPKLPGKSETREEKKFNLEVQLEMQKKIEAYLVSKLEENDELIATTQNDIEVIKELQEKEAKDKSAAIVRTKDLEADLAITREELEDKEQILSQHVNDLETKVTSPAMHSCEERMRNTMR